MKDKIVSVNYIDEEGVEKQERCQVEYIGHTYEFVETPVTRLVDGYLIESASKMPMQVVVYVCRVLSTGDVIQVKPEGVKYSPISAKL